MRKKRDRGGEWLHALTRWWRIDRRAKKKRPSAGDAAQGDMVSELLSRGKNDLPSSLRMESDTDAPDEEVQRWAGLGQLHPATNMGVVFRVAFAHRLHAGEHLLVVGEGENVEGRAAFSFARVSSALIDASQWPEPEGAWVLATTWGLRWHHITDGVPGVEPVVPPAAQPGPRDLAYADIASATTQVAASDDDKVHRLSLGRGTARRRIVHIFEYVEDKGNRELFEVMLRRIAAERGWTEATLEHLLRGIEG